MSERIQIRRDTSERWYEYNPLLLEGEIGYVTDSRMFKIGDGIHAWNELPYLVGGGGGGDDGKVMTGYTVCDTTSADSSKAVTVTDITILTTGIRLLVKMANANTASNVVMNVNSLGAKPLFYNGKQVSGDNSWKAGEVLDIYYDGTNLQSCNVMGSASSGSNMILEWNTDVATTRKQVSEDDRKAGMQISYKNPDKGWVNEQYIGATVTDTEWVKDNNWKSFDHMELVDSYESYSKTSAPTADALRRLHLEHVKDITDLSDAMTDLENKVNAVLDMVSSSSEIGVSPASIEVSSEAQDVRVQIICNGDWTVSEVPESVEVTPLSGTGNGYVTVKFPANESEEDEVTGSFKITNSFSKGKTVSFTQHAAEKTYVYELSVLPASLELGAAAGNGVLSITSKRTAYINGSPAGAEEVVSFTLSSDAEWLHVQNTGEYTYDENTQENSRSAAITVTQDGGKVVTVDSIQDAAVIEWVYEFTVSPQTVSLVNAGTAQTVEVTSRKQKRVNGVNDGDAVSVDYSSSATAGFRISGNSISADQNNTENAKSGTATFTQNESGKAVTVTVSQAAGTVTWEYTFTVSPTSLSFSEKGETKSVTVTSTKQKKINGVNDGDTVPVGYTRSNSGTGVSGSGSSVTMPENTSTSSRSGKVTFTQSESGKKSEVSLTQSAGKVTYAYSLSVSSQSVTLDAKGTAQTLTVTSKRQKYVNGKASGGLEDYDWNFDLQSGFTYTKVSQTQLRINGGNNTTTNQKTGQCIIRQKTDGGKSATVNVTQSKGVQTTEYDVAVNPNRLTWSINELSTKSATVSFVSIIKWNGIEVSRGSASGNITKVNATANVQQLFDGWYSGTTVYVQKNLNQVGHGSCEIQTSRGNITITLTTTN